MHRALLTAAVLATVSLGLPASARAQFTPLADGQPHVATFQKSDALYAGSQLAHLYRLAEPVSKGRKLVVQLKWLDPHPQFQASLSISDPGSITSDVDVTTLEIEGGNIAEKTFTESGAVTIMVTAPAANAGHRYRIVATEVTPTEVGETRSITSGLHVAAGWNSMTFASQFSTEVGTGESFRGGLGLGWFTVYAERQSAEMLPEDDASDYANGYTLVQTDVGARIHLLRQRNRIRPFGQFAMGLRRLEGNDGVTEAQGVSMAPGAGVEVFLLSRLSLEGSWSRATGDVDKARNDGGEWLDLPAEYVIRGTTTRFAVQGVLHF